MKTKPIPAIVMLVAGLVACIAGMAGHMETGRFVKMLLVVLIVFYIIGGIVKLLIDKNFSFFKIIISIKFASIRYW